jgi:hypothetical protein
MPFERADRALGQLNLLEVFQEIRRGDALERRRNYEPLDVAGVSRWHSKHGSCVRNGHVLFDYRPSRSQIGFTICRNRNHGFLPHVADARMPVWGVLAILSSFLLVVLSKSGQRWLYFASLLMLILFVIFYNLLSKPINRIQTEAAKTGGRLDNGRELQASWNRVLLIRVPLLVVSLLSQCLVLLVASA